MRFRHRGVVAEAFRDQHRLGHRRVAAAAHQQFEDVVEGGGVAAARLHHRLDVVHAGIEQGMGEPGLVALHPVGVAVQRVDLAVMGQRAEGLGQAPGGESVGRVALVVDREARHEAFVEQIRVEFRQALGQEHALVDDRPARQRAEVEFRDLRGDGLLLDPAADDIEVALIARLVALLGVPDQDLLDLGAGGVRLLADAGDVDRHLAPGIDGVAGVQHLGLDDLAAAFLRAEIGLRQEHHPHRDAARLHLVAAALDDFREEILRALDVDAGAVTGLPIGIHGAAVPHRLQRVDAGLHNLAGCLAVQRGDEADAAGVMLRHIDVGTLKDRLVGGVAGGEFGAGLGPMGHGGHSAATARVLAFCWM